jgi:hypothetical protein
MGIELQLVELVDQQRTAEVQGRPEEVAALQREIDGLHAELADVADDLPAA